MGKGVFETINDIVHAINEMHDSVYGDADELYYCIECGERMELVDETDLVCPSCGHSVLVDDYYGEIKSDEYEELYPTLEELEAREKK